MAVVHVALERSFVGSFPAVGADPIGEARRCAAEGGVLPAERDGEARCLVRDGHAVYRISATDTGWLVGSFQAGGEPCIPVGRFASEGAAHDWLLGHLGFARTAVLGAASQA
ncbi:MAG TPA: hypothetical protein VGM25_07280 [Caulobacteraceae bacterium]|jgi:hypothetical protein